MPAIYRTVFLLHDVEGFSNPEIAETLHVKLGTIKSRVHRTRLFLRKRLADYMDGASRIAQVTEPRRLLRDRGFQSACALPLTTARGRLGSRNIAAKRPYA